MFNNLRIAYIVGAIAVLGVASPAFAQLLDPNVGTGNLAACYYDTNGVLQTGVPGTGQIQFAVPRGGESAFAEVPEVAADSNHPALTGGGSVGYNQSLLAY